MMSFFKTATATPDTIPNPRAIVYRTRGHRSGPITRLISPGDLGELLKPFVFLDLFEIGQSNGQGFAPHPHSGIATHTTFLEGSMTYADSTGKSGSLTAGSVEWMRAGAGVWHTGNSTSGEATRGYQLWLALPDNLELAPAESYYLEPGQIEGVSPWRVLLGSYGEKTSPLPLPAPLTYLHVQLKDGDSWTYHPDADHDIAWLALNTGRLHTTGLALERELAVFAEGGEPIEMVAEGDVELVIGSATKHRHKLVTGYYSVHTTADALTRGEQNIEDMKHTPAVAQLRR